MSRNQHQLEYDHMGSFGSNARWKVLPSDSATPTAGTLGLYAKGAGMYVIDSSGTVTGPLGPTGSAAGAFGSNANDVGNPSTGGANSSNSRADHVHLGIRSVAANSSNNLTQPNIGLVSGAGIAFTVSASTLTISALGSGGGGGGSVSYGSNATDVSSVSAVGGSSNVAREDHVHKGVHQITSNTSNGKVGDVNLTAGSGIALGVSGQNVTITNISSGSGGGGGSSGANASHPMPLDSYTLDGTYGDDFTSASLAGIWTRRNFTSGAETRQFGPKATYMRISTSGRAAGDGYFQTAPGGDWTFAMASVQRIPSSDFNSFGVAVVDSSGNGAVAAWYDSPLAMLSEGVTTYSSYSGAFGQTTTRYGSFTINLRGEQKQWIYLRKSGTNYYAAFSLDGEVWSDESSALSWGGTVDRVGMLLAPLSSIPAIIDVDWFNKIA